MAFKNINVVRVANTVWQTGPDRHRRMRTGRGIDSMQILGGSPPFPFHMDLQLLGAASKRGGFQPPCGFTPMRTGS